ncbi:MAG: 30S ribosomal protein S1 [Crocinitomicaceae bacterium]|nr:30S ribosomal protein S1 [Crocinitomicaceae bacterium]|tara:strand:+ start:1151 stop:3133 length:1983 start_codon:yes stop_codon:yes gene_type:complete
MAEEKKENAAEEVANQTPEATTDAPTPKAEKVDVEAEASKTEETEEAPKKEAIEVPTEAVDYKSVEPLDDFDWDSIGKTKDNYKEEARKEMEEAYNETLTSIAEHEVLEGKIVTLTKKEAVINIGYKSEGIIPISEFRYNPDLKVGDGVEVYVDSQEDKNGQLVLSHKKARTLKAWDNVNDAKDNEKVINGYVKCRTKGGLIVDVFGLEAFLPGSQIDVKPIRDYDQFVGKTMEFKVVKINKEFRNVVVSHKALIEAELEQQKAQIMQQLEKGQVLEGIVKNITSYGVFIDLGGVDGLIHITDLSWGRINHPEEVVELDQKIKVVILDFDDDKKRIALGLKQLQPHPWDSLDENLKVGDKVKGKVVVLADYGAFVEIAPGVEGLIHVSEMSWSQHLRTAQDFFKVGDEVEAVIMTLDREERKMSLSTRRLTPDPWEAIEGKYPVESKHKGKITNLSNFGVFVELEEGIDGLIHISDLSWSKKINHPSEFCKVGEDIEVVVLEIDKDNRRLSLGHKQLEENPWDVFETVFTVGSVHQGTVLSDADKGYIVALPYGVEGFCPNRHGVKEDGSKIKVDEQIDFQVIEFNKDAKKIIVSHARLHEEAAELEAENDKKKKVARSKKTRQAVRSLNDNQEKTTLGDLDALSALKEQMEDEEKNSKK